MLEVRNFFERRVWSYQVDQCRRAVATASKFEAAYTDQICCFVLS